MRKQTKLLLIASLVAGKVILTACDTGETDSYTSSSSGSSSGSGSYTLSPKIHNSSYGSTCNTQTAVQYQAADVRYDQYVECMQIYNGDPSCEGYYTNYQAQVELAEQTRTSLGC